MFDTITKAAQNKLRARLAVEWLQLAAKCTTAVPWTPPHESSAAHKNSTGSEAVSARGSTLAGRPTTCYVQAAPAGVQVSTRLGTAVSSRALCTSCWRHAAPQALFCHSRTTGFSWVNMKNYGRRAFSYAGPHAWKSLPEHLQQSTSIDLCKRWLETFLFEQISHSAH